MTQSIQSAHRINNRTSSEQSRSKSASGSFPLMPSSSPSIPPPNRSGSSCSAITLSTAQGVRAQHLCSIDLVTGCYCFGGCGLAAERNGTSNELEWNGNNRTEPSHIPFAEYHAHRILIKLGFFRKLSATSVFEFR